MSAAQAGKRRSIGYQRSSLAEYQVYLLGNKHLNWYKIGISSNTNERKKDLQLPFEVKALSVLEMSEPRTVAQRVEKLLHDHFFGQRVRGEWFHSISIEDFERLGKEALSLAKGHSFPARSIRITRVSAKRKKKFGLDSFREAQ